VPLTTAWEKRVLPAGDNVSRLALEDELFGVRAIRHVFRAKPNLTLQGWATLMQPVAVAQLESDPTTWLLTTEILAPRKAAPPKRIHVSPEYVAARHTLTGSLVGEDAALERRRATGTAQTLPNRTAPSVRRATAPTDSRRRWPGVTPQQEAVRA
jgi:hypothetical protein